MAEEYKHLIRVANTDLDGSKPICHALKKIKGVGVMFANMMCNIAGIDRTKKAGTLMDKEIEMLDNVLRDPLKYGAPEWMLNRRNDYATGENKHLVTTDIRFVQSNDIRRLQKIKSNRGLRHAWGLPVRGQRTRSNFRRNKGKVQGVQRKKIQPAKGGGAKKGK